jgi:hypothetical protein
MRRSPRRLGTCSVAPTVSGADALSQSGRDGAGKAITIGVRAFDARDAYGYWPISFGRTWAKLAPSFTTLTE